MYKSLSQLLNKPEQFIESTLGELEKLAGYPSEDIRLVADNKRQINQKMLELGLDPSDTTAEELYHALLAKLGSDAKIFDQALTARSEISDDQKIELATQVCHQVYGDSQVWALKPTAAKRLLILSPPKQVMKVLNYRSASSMIKRQPTPQIFLLAKILETDNWNMVNERRAAKLPSSSWQTQSVKFETLRLPQGKLKDSTKLYSWSKETGSVGLLPAAVRERSSILNLVLLLIEAVEALGIQPQAQKIANLNPVLNWWSNARHLISDHGGSPVSFNISDLAKSHMLGFDFSNRFMNGGQESLWQELLGRYKNYAYEPSDVSSQEAQTPNNSQDTSDLPKNFAYEQWEA